jgi:hypothetical protein
MVVGQGFAVWHCSTFAPGRHFHSVEFHQGFHIISLLSWWLVGSISQQHNVKLEKIVAESGAADGPADGRLKSLGSTAAQLLDSAKFR